MIKKFKVVLTVTTSYPADDNDSVKDEIKGIVKSLGYKVKEAKVTQIKLR